MKKQFNWVWGFAALAVVASPLSMNHFIVKSENHGVYRSIASEEEVKPQTEQPADPYPHLSRFQATQVNQQVNINITVNDPEVIKKLNDELNAEKKKGEELRAQLGQSQADLSQAREADVAKAAKISELEKQVSEHVARVAELEAKVKELESNAQISKEELDKTKLALADAKKAADDACLALEEANKKVAVAQEELKKKEEELKKKEEELAAKSEEAKKKDEALAKKEEEAKKRDEEIKAKEEELAKNKKDHDMFVCQSEERFSVLNKQIEELNKQQQQFTQVMLGLNQVLIGLFSQMQNQNQNHQQMNVLGMPGQQGNGMQGYFGNMYSMGQMPQASQPVVQGSYMFNPWQQQTQPQVINNYYGMSMMGQGQMGQMGQMGMGQGQMGQMGQMGMGGYGQQYYQQSMPGSFNFGGMDDGSRVMFGGFQSQANQLGQVMM